MTKARQTIHAQETPRSIKHSAWYLFRHQLADIDPLTSVEIKQALAHTLAWMQEQKARQEAALKRLTPMQNKILHLLVEEGLTQKQMALRLNRKRSVIQHHYAQIRLKMGVPSMYQAVAVAVESGWVNAPHIKK